MTFGFGCVTGDCLEVKVVDLSAPESKKIGNVTRTKRIAMIKIGPTGNFGLFSAVTDDF